jgi:hypothetical protein
MFCFDNIIALRIRLIILLNKFNKTDLLDNNFIRNYLILPRKEWIHPQLPLRMPCYDFAPIIDPTFCRPTTTFGHYRLS